MASGSLNTIEKRLGVYPWLTSTHFDTNTDLTTHRKIPLSTPLYTVLPLYSRPLLASHAMVSTEIGDRVRKTTTESTSTKKKQKILLFQPLLFTSSSLSFSVSLSLVSSLLCVVGLCDHAHDSHSHSHWLSVFPS